MKQTIDNIWLKNSLESAYYELGRLIPYYFKGDYDYQFSNTVTRLSFDNNNDILIKKIAVIKELERQLNELHI